MKLRSTLAQGISLSLLMGLSGQLLAAPAPNSSEFRQNWGTGAIQVLPAWNQGAAGLGAIVAVLDTGVNAGHYELQGRIAPGGKDFFSGDNNPADEDPEGHGTSMAGMVAANFNNSGILGVAYQAKVLPIRVYDRISDGHFASSQQRTAAINYAAQSNASVMVMAYHTEPSGAEINALKNAAAQGKLLIAAAGNNNNSIPNNPSKVMAQLGGAGIIVGGITESRKSFGNRAGQFKDVYMVASAVDNTAPSNSSGSFTTWVGNSMAAPQVAGAAAVLLSHAPNLTNTQLAELLLNNATDLGAPGVDTTYGHGLLNVNAALQAQGSLEGPSDDDSGSSSGLGAAAVALAVGGGVAYWLIKNKDAKKQIENTLVLDSYNRPYIMNLNNAITVRDTGPRLFDVMDMFDRQSRTMEVPLSENISASMYTSTNNPSDYFYLKDSDPFMETEEQILAENVSLRLNGNFENGLFFNVQSNQAPGSDFDEVNGMSLSENFVMGGALSNAYMGFGASADSMSMGYSYNDHYSMSVGTNRINDHETHGLQSNTATIQGTYRPNELSSLSLRMSEITEKGSLLGGASDSVFSVSRSKTTALGLTGSHKVFDKLSVFANYTHGFTNVDEQRGSFLQDFTGLQSHAYSFGLLGNDLINYKDKAGIAISSPLRVSNGGVTLIVPHSIDYSAGTVSRTSTHMDMSDAPSEIDFEAFYTMNLNRGTNVGTYLTYRDIPSDDPKLGGGTALFATLGMKF